MKREETLKFFTARESLCSSAATAEDSHYGLV